MKRYISLIMGLTVLALMVGVAGCSKPGPTITPGALAAQAPKVIQTGSGVTVKTASDWASAHPDIYASYMKNGENSEFYSYPEAYPMIQTLYEGMAFSRFYNSARGHVYTVQDLDATGRPHPFANCFTCKTPNFTATAIELGAAAYSVAYDEVKERFTEPVSCFNCHANDAASLTVTHTYLSDALGQDLLSVSPAKLACAQCHVEYYFDPATRATTLPYSSLSVMNPDEILAYYNNPANFSNNIAFADYTNPRSGVRQIKVQHPEFETFMGEGGVHANQFNCSTCHMGTAVNSRGKAYTSHEWKSPLQNPNLVKSNCASCHTDLAADIGKIQEKTHGRLAEIGQSLVELTEGLVAAVGTGRYSDENLNAIRKVARDAQFYWDFVFVENSDGAHNSRLTYKCLDKSESLVNEAKTLLTSL